MNDSVTSVSGVMGIDINKELLTCRASRSTYAVFLEESRQARLPAGDTKKRKCVAAPRSNSTSSTPRINCLSQVFVDTH